MSGLGEPLEPYVWLAALCILEMVGTKCSDLLTMCYFDP